MGGCGGGGAGEMALPPHQVLLNLLSNGIKFTAAGEVCLTVVPRAVAGAEGSPADGPSWEGEAVLWASDEAGGGAAARGSGGGAPCAGADGGRGGGGEAMEGQ